MMRRTRALLVLVFALIAMSVPSVVLAQDATDEEGLLLRVNGSVTVGADQTIDNVIVIGDNATVDGTVTGALVVVNGDAVVTGNVGDEVTVIRGTLTLESNAQVDNVTVIRGDLVQDPGATVTGSITEGNFQVSPWEWGVFWALMWLGSTLVVLVSGLVFAGIGGRQVKIAGDAITGSLGPTLLGALVVWIALPILAVLVFLTLIGIPLGVGYFLFLLPIIWFLGYLVAGTQIGRAILSSRSDAPHPYLPALLGLGILQIIGIIPFFGGLVAFLAGVVGSGALLVVAWRAWRGPGAEPERAPARERSPSPAD